MIPQGCTMIDDGVEGVRRTVSRYIIVVMVMVEYHDLDRLLS